MLWGCNAAPDQLSAEMEWQGQNLALALHARKQGGYWLTANHGGREMRAFPIPWPVFRLECADINAVGRPNALIGVIKESPLDSVVRRRLFIYQLNQEIWEPLWLSSRLSHPLEDFALTGSGQEIMVRTIEKEQNGLYLIAEYRYGKFGLDFVRFAQRDLALKEAQLILHP